MIAPRLGPPATLSQRSSLFTFTSHPHCTLRADARGTPTILFPPTSVSDSHRSPVGIHVWAEVNHCSERSLTTEIHLPTCEWVSEIPHVVCSDLCNRTQFAPLALVLIHSLSVSAETLVVEWELARGDGDGDGGRRGGGLLSGQCQAALTVGVLSCVRADMFTVCTVFYELLPLCLLFLLSLPCPSPCLHPPPPPRQWRNEGEHGEPEKWDDLLQLTCSLTNVVLLPLPALLHASISVQTSC